MKGERHPDVTALLADDPSLDREDLLRHVGRCAVCRARLAVEDASRLFGLLALEPVPQGVLDRVSRAVDRATAEGPVVAPARPSWVWPAASVAASLVLAGFFATYVLRHEEAPQRELALVPLPAREAADAEARFELLASPGEAQVVDLAVGDVQLVMIFDEELDL